MYLSKCITPCLWYLTLEVKQFSMNLLHGHGKVVFLSIDEKSKKLKLNNMKAVLNPASYHIFQINVFVFVTI